MSANLHISSDSLEGTLPEHDTVEMNKTVENTDSQNKKLLQLFIFQGKEYLGFDCFAKEKIIVGKCEKADLILNGHNVADIHAFFYIKGHHVLVSDGNLGSGVRVNGKFVSTYMLGPLDYVTIGKYNLKAKLKTLEDSSSEDSPSLEENSDWVKDTHGHNEKILSDISEGQDQITYLDQEDKKDFGKAEGAENSLEISAEIVPDPQQDIEREPESNNEGNSDFSSEKMNFSEEKDNTLESANSAFPEKTGKRSSKNIIDKISALESFTDFSSDISGEAGSFAVKSYEIEEEKEQTTGEEEADNDDETADEGKQQYDMPVFEKQRQEEDQGSNFSLKDTLLQFNKLRASQIKGELVLEVIKCRGNSIIDMSFLGKKEKYYSMGEENQFRLAENRNSEIFYFFLKEEFRGKLIFNDTLSIDFNSLCIQENLHDKDKNIYRCSLPINTIVTLNDGFYDYYLRIAILDQESQMNECIEQITKATKKKTFFLKNLLKSIFLHSLIFLFANALIIFLPYFFY